MASMKMVQLWQTDMICIANAVPQPQLQFMSVDWSPLPEAYLMIEAFLCTETTHHQSLRVVVNQTHNDDEVSSDKKMKIDSLTAVRMI